MTETVSHIQIIPFPIEQPLGLIFLVNKRGVLGTNLRLDGKHIDLIVPQVHFFIQCFKNQRLTERQHDIDPESELLATEGWHLKQPVSRTVLYQVHAGSVMDEQGEVNVLEESLEDVGVGGC